MAGGAQRRDGRPAAEADEVLQEDIGPEAELLRDIAGQPRAEVAGAGADEQCVHLASNEAGLRQR